MRQRLTDARVRPDSVLAELRAANSPAKQKAGKAGTTAQKTKAGKAGTTAQKTKAGRAGGKAGSTAQKTKAGKASGKAGATADAPAQCKASPSGPECLHGHHHAVPPVPEQTLAAVTKEAQHALRDINNPQVCLVCDELHPERLPSDATSTDGGTARVAFADAPPDSLLLHLSHSADLGLPEDLAAQYTLHAGLMPGADVRVHGLTVHVHLNDEQGTVLGTTATSTTARHVVRMKRSGNVVHVRASNLTPRVHEKWAELMLSPRSLPDKHGNAFVCVTCSACLRLSPEGKVTDDRSRLPKMSIRNGLYHGVASQIDALRILTDGEWDLLSGCRSRKSLHYVHASFGKASRRPKLVSHVVSVETPKELLASTLGELSSMKQPSTIVYMTPNLASDADLAMAARDAYKRVQVDVGRLDGAFAYLRANSNSFSGAPAPAVPPLDDNGVPAGAFYICARQRPADQHQQSHHASHADAAVCSRTDRADDVVQTTNHQCAALDPAWQPNKAHDPTWCVGCGLLDCHQTMAGLHQSSEPQQDEAKPPHPTVTTIHTSVTHRVQQVASDPTHASGGTLPHDHRCLYVLNDDRRHFVPYLVEPDDGDPVAGTVGFARQDAGHGRATLLTNALEPVQHTVDGVNAALSAQHYSVVYSAGGSLFQSWDMSTAANAYPRLFPFGRGCFDEAREVAVGAHEFVAHTLRLAPQQFAESDDWILHMFDVLNKARAHGSLSATLRSSATRANAAASVTVDDLRQACAHLEAVTDALKSGRPVPDAPNTAAADLLSSLRSSRKQMFGTFEHALMNRHKVFACEHRFGAHHIWSTTTPDDLASLSLLKYVYAGKTVPDDAPNDDTVAAVCRNSGATARHFDLTMKVLTDTVFGFRRNRAAKAEDGVGLFGPCRAFAAMVEEQQRLSLHVHACVYITGLPCTMQGLLRQLRTGTFVDSLVAYIDQVESANHLLTQKEIEVLAFEQHRPRDASHQDDVDGDGDLHKSEWECTAPDTEFSASDLLEHYAADSEDSDFDPEPTSFMTSHPTQQLSAKDVHSIAMPANYRMSAGPKPHLPHPHNLYCTRCAQTIASSHDVLKTWALLHATEDVKRAFNAGNTGLQDINFEVEPALDKDDVHHDSSRAALTLVMLHYMVHDPGHRKGCFKTKRDTRPQQCRYGRPVTECFKTVVRLNGSDVCSCDGECSDQARHIVVTADVKANEVEVVVNRVRGSEYIANHNLRKFALFRSNNCDRVVAANPGAIYYTTTYCAKLVNNKDTCATMVSALERALERHANSNKTTAQRGWSTAFSLFNANTSTIEVPSTIAALWLLRKGKGIHYFSHDFAALHLNHVHAYLNGDQDVNTYRFKPAAADDAADDEPSGKFVLGANALDDYAHRPDSLSDMPLYWFVCHHHRVVRHPADSPDTALIFKHGHPKSATHKLVKWNVEKVPLFTGARLADVKQLDLGDHDDAAASRYCCLALALYKPWCVDKPLKGADRDWIDEFDDWSPPKEASHMLEHHQHYHEAKRVAHVSANKRDVLNQATAHGNVVVQCVDVDAHDVDLAGCSFENFCNAVPFPERTLPPGIRAFVQGLSIQPNAKDATLPTSTLKAKTALARWPLDTTVPLDDLEPVGPINDARTATTRVPTSPEATLVPSVEVAGAVSGVASSSAAHQTLPHRPTVAQLIADTEVNHAHNALHVLQKKAIALLCTLVVRDHHALHHSISTLPPTHNLCKMCKSVGLTSVNQQVLCFLSGQGGSGKSTVIKAVQRFADAWDMPNAVKTTATIGTAALNIGGCTVFRYTQSARPVGTLQRGRTNAHLHSLLVVDEVSLMGRGQLGQIHRALNVVGNVPNGGLNAPFGGASMVFVGDHSQLPAVQKSPLFEPVQQPIHPEHFGDPTNHTVNKLGAHLWQARLTHAMVLTHNFRANVDPDYQTFLLNLRNAVVTPAHRKKLHACEVTPKNMPPPDATHVYWTRTNVVAANFELVHIAAAATALPVYRLHTDVTMPDGSKLPNAHGARNGYELGTSPSKDDKVPLTYFDFHEGMLVTLAVKSHEHLHLNIANGSTARIIGTVPPLHTLPFVEAIHRAPGRHHKIRVLQQMPTAFLVHNETFATRLDSHINEDDTDARAAMAGVVAIVPTVRKQFSVHNVDVPVTVTHFSMRHVFARTCHILQGTTLPAMVLGQLCLRDNWIYTALSRIASWRHLFILQSVAINSIGKPRQKPNPGRAADDRRIAALEQKNLTSHHSSGRVSPCPSGLHPLSFLPINRMQNRLKL